METLWINLLQSVKEFTPGGIYRFHQQWKIYWIPLYKLILIVLYNSRIKLGKNFSRNHAVPRLFLKNCFEGEVVYLSPVEKILWGIK